MARHRDIPNRRRWWQIKLEYKHRWHAFQRDVAYDWREFWADVAEYRAERKGNK